MAKQAHVCAVWLNYASVWWFWFTIIGVFYFGLGHVLPVVYAGYSYWFFTLQHLWTYIMFLEMIINWACVKFIHSPYNHDDQNLEAAAMATMNGGFEINLNQMRNGTDQGSYYIPAGSISGIKNGTQKIPTNKTMYLVALGDDDCTEKDSHKRVVYPYWSWKPCLICQRPRPPRTHHCPLCQTCVLKRDHHCFFTGSCIGLRNQRHFIVFSFWAGMATLYCLIHSIIYVYVDFGPRNTYWDLLLPVTLLRCLLGYISYSDTLKIVLLYSVSWFCLTSIGFFIEQLKCTRKGVTSFEEDNNIKIVTTGTVDQHVSGVFGKNYLLNFLFPMHVIFPSEDDGVRWEHVKS